MWPRLTAYVLLVLGLPTFIFALMDARYQEAFFWGSMVLAGVGLLLTQRHREKSLLKP